ncbi:MAG: hypothetical protein M9938_07540 [Solirubrobacterales bacterium]|nr:hypothetical protein [Solirubrobacterales bacterium]
MSKSRQISAPTETIELPAPSWAPAVFALGLLGLAAGTFASGFMFPAWFYGAVGAVIAIAALASMIGRGRRAFYSLPRTSSDQRASLPVESFDAPPKG